MTQNSEGFAKGSPPRLADEQTSQESPSGESTPREQTTRELTPRERKRQLRRAYLAIRQNVSEDERKAHDAAVCASVVDLLERLPQSQSQPDSAQSQPAAEPRAGHSAPLNPQSGGRPHVIGLYYPLQGEVDIARLYAECTKRGWIFGLPKCNLSDKTMQFYRVGDASSLVPGAYGIPEPAVTSQEMWIRPESLTAIVIPGVAFDTTGTRLGYGGGYYDRFLADTDIAAVRIGVAYQVQLVQSLPADERDRKMDYIVTEAEVVACRPRP